MANNISMMLLFFFLYQLNLKFKCIQITGNLRVKKQLLFSFLVEIFLRFLYTLLINQNKFFFFSHPSETQKEQMMEL